MSVSIPPQGGPILSMYTQIPDALIERYGLVRAAVYGRIRRYAMRDGQCSVALADVARALGMGERTVRRHVDALESDGFIAVVRTPGETHVITLTGALQFAEAKDEGSVALTGLPRSQSPGHPGQRVRTTPATKSGPPVTVAGPPRSESPDYPGHKVRGPRSESPGTPATVTGDLRKDTRETGETGEEEGAEVSRHDAGVCGDDELFDAFVVGCGRHTQLLNPTTAMRISEAVEQVAVLGATPDVVRRAAASFAERMKRAFPLRSPSPPTPSQLAEEVGRILVEDQHRAPLSPPGDARCYHRTDEGRWVRSAPSIVLQRFGLDPYTPQDSWPDAMLEAFADRLAEVAGGAR